MSSRKAQPAAYLCPLIIASLHPSACADVATFSARWDRAGLRRIVRLN